MPIDINQVPSPAFILDESRLRQNLELMARVQREAGIEIILALKGFAMWSAFPLVKQYLAGATASSLYEARLCYEEMGKAAHTYCVAYRPSDLEAILSYSSHLTFNSLTQFHSLAAKAKAIKPDISLGLRINPEISDVETELYNPAAKGSRLGLPLDDLATGLPAELDGLHFHVLCESSSHSLAKVLQRIEAKLGHLLPQLKWINMGGGHLMTREGYDVDHLIGLLRDFKARYGVEIVLEPGSAVAWDTGVLVAQVVDIFTHHGIRTAILDVSFTDHMPDTLEMPYRPRIRGASDPAENTHHYRLGGLSCLAGDYMSEYGFDHELQIGQKLVFEDMIHYTMVKTTMFNGLHHPSIAIWTEDQQLKMAKEFTYEDYKRRLS